MRKHKSSSFNLPWICRALESGSEITELRSRVEAFAVAFAMPGFDVTAIHHSNGAANGAHAVAV